MDNEAKKAHTIFMEREAVPLVFDREEDAYKPAPYTGRTRNETAPSPPIETLPGYAAYRPQERTHERQIISKDKEGDYKMLVSAVAIMGAMGMGILVVRTLYSFSPFVTMVMVGSGLLYVLSPARKVEAPSGAEPKVPRKTPRIVSHEEEEITIFYYKSKKINKTNYDS